MEVQILDNENFKLPYYKNGNFTSHITSVKINNYKNCDTLENVLNVAFVLKNYFYLLKDFILFEKTGYVIHDGHLEMNLVHGIVENIFHVGHNDYLLLDLNEERVVVKRKRKGIKRRVNKGNMDLDVVVDGNITNLKNTTQDINYN